MQGWCSDDSFWYFQPWLIGLGHDAFEQVAASPDSLADLPQVRRLAGRPSSDWSDDEWPEWDLLNYIALKAYERATGQRTDSTTPSKRRASTASAMHSPRTSAGITTTPTNAGRNSHASQTYWANSSRRRATENALRLTDLISHNDALDVSLGRAGAVVQVPASAGCVEIAAQARG
ncbi:DUF4240 domain-containing protein [Nonomuraea sp. NPDC003707]